MENKETRQHQLPSEQDSNRCEGVAANFQEYDLGSFREVVEPTAFRNLDKYDIHALLNHNYDKTLARSKYGAGTLELLATERGLEFGFEFPETGTGKEARELVTRGDIDQCSWAFTVKQERWEDLNTDKPLRVIEQVGEIYDISLTPRGANPSTSVAMRSLEDAKKAQETPEQKSINTNTMEDNNTPNEKEQRFIPAAEVQGKLSAEERAIKDFNIVKAINEARNGKLTGLEAEINQEGINEKRKIAADYRDQNAVNLPEFMFQRTQTVGTAADGGELVFTEPGRYVDFLYPSTPMLSQVSVAENLVGNVEFPRQTSAYSLNWQTETGADTAQDINFDSVTMSPKRAVITASLSNQLLRQEYSRGIQNRIIGELNRGFNKGLEDAVLNADGTSNKPTGIYTSLAAQAMSLGAISFDDLVDMEAALAENDALFGNLSYVTHPNVVAKLKKTKVDAGSGRFLVEGMLDPVKTANGYNIYNTTLSKKTAGTPDTYGILFGNMSDVQIGFWGGASLIVDPYTNMKSSIVEIYVERFMDVAVLRDESFALATDVTI